MSVLGKSSALFFLRFLSGFGVLRLLRNQYFSLLAFELRLFYPRVFYRGVLRVALVIELIVTLAPLVHFLDEQIGLKTCFGLGIDRFFDYF